MLKKIGSGPRSRSLVLTKTITASEYENDSRAHCRLGVGGGGGEEGEYALEERRLLHRLSSSATICTRDLSTHVPSYLIPCCYYNCF